MSVLSVVVHLPNSKMSGMLYMQARNEASERMNREGAAATLLWEGNDETMLQTVTVAVSVNVQPMWKQIIEAFERTKGKNSEVSVDEPYVDTDWPNALDLALKITIVRKQAHTITAFHEYVEDVLNVAMKVQG